ncbi:MAG: hypothetical protein AAF850_07865 [Pseudomonadota bacterium]
MSNYLKWPLFLNAPVFGVLLIYALWTEGITADVVKVAVSVIIVNLTLGSMVAVSQARNDNAAPSDAQKN